jgi:hypothetical protein
LLCNRKLGEVADVNVDLTCLIYVVRLDVPSSAAGDASVFERVVGVRLEALENLGPKECGRYLPRQVALLEVADDMKRASGRLDIAIIFAVVNFENCIFPVRVTWVLPSISTDTFE